MSYPIKIYSSNKNLATKKKGPLMKQFKRSLYLRFITTLIFILCMTSVSLGADATEKSSFDYFTKKFEYTEDTFKDISLPWIKKAIQPSYELGLMSGRNCITFDPNGFVTIAEAISISTRIHEIYHGGDGIMEKIGSKWFDGAVIYAIDNGIIKAGQFYNYDNNATRADIATIFSHALPANALTPINSIKIIPDVATSSPYFDPILCLYNAGVVSGIDDYGTFHPSKNITRAEASAIVTHIAVPTQRKKFSLSEKPQLTVKSFTSKDNSFVILASTDWIENNPYHSIYSQLELSTYDNLCQLVAVTTQKKDVFQHDFSSYSSACISDLVRNLQDASSSPAVNTILNGNNAIFTDVKGTMDGVPMDYHIMLIEKDSYYILISTVFPDSIEKEARSRVNLLLQQFTFKENDLL